MENLYEYLIGGKKTGKRFGQQFGDLFEGDILFEYVFGINGTKKEEKQWVIRSIKKLGNLVTFDCSNRYDRNNYTSFSTHAPNNSIYACRTSHNMNPNGKPKWEKRYHAFATKEITFADVLNNLDI